MQAQKTRALKLKALLSFSALLYFQTLKPGCCFKAGVASLHLRPTEAEDRHESEWSDPGGGDGGEVCVVGDGPLAAPQHEAWVLYSRASFPERRGMVIPCGVRGVEEV